MNVINCLRRFEKKLVTVLWILFIKQIIIQIVYAQLIFDSTKGNKPKKLY